MKMYHKEQGRNRLNVAEKIIFKWILKNQGERL
jgi:hypothetical protein